MINTTECAYPQGQCPFPGLSCRDCRCKGRYARLAKKLENEAIARQQERKDKIPLTSKPRGGIVWVKQEDYVQELVRDKKL